MHPKFKLKTICVHVVFFNIDSPNIQSFLIINIQTSFVPVPSNIMVMIVAMWKKEMRTARNIFIFNLALSDFLLALSIPFTLTDALTKVWIFPNSEASCW